jgi:WD40 repeat protein
MFIGVYMKKLLLITFMSMLLFSASALKAELDTVMTKKMGGDVQVVKFSPDGNYVYALAQNYYPIKITTLTGEIVKTYDSATFVSGIAMDLSPDGEWLAVAENNENVCILNTETGKIEKKENVGLDTNSITSFVLRYVALSHNKKYLATTYTYTSKFDYKTISVINIWDLESDTTVFSRLIGYGDTASTVKIKFTSDNKYLIIGHACYPDSSRIEFLNVGTWDMAFILPGHSNSISDLSFSPDGSLLASSSWDGYIKIWDIVNKSLYKSYNNDGHGDAVYTVCFFNSNIILGGG